jgi:sulfonate transport system substrate-binding protein
MSKLTRRTFTASSAAAIATLAATKSYAAGKTVRIGYQKYGNLVLLKANGILEEKLKPLGYSVDWKQFVAGPQLLEALGAGAVDFGTTGETPPVFAQAAGAPLVYLGTEPPAPLGEAIIVLKDSPITSVAGLKGKRVAFNKGSNVHYLLVRALEKAGLSIEDIAPVYLAPPDGLAAFERKAVDAWAIWDPYLASAQAALPTRLLTDATGIVPNHQFYLGSRRFTDQAVVTAFKDSIAQIDRDTAGNPRAGAKLLAPVTGIPEDVVADALARQTWAIQPIDSKIIAAQQEIADTFFKLGLIPKAIKVSDAMPGAPS